MQTYPAVTHLNFAKGFRGGERQTFLLIKELAKKGLQQQLFVRKNSKLTLRCKDIPNLRIVEISKPYIMHIPKLKASDILHAHETKALQFAYFASKTLSLPYIVTRRVDNPVTKNFFNKALYKNASAVVALSSAIKKEILKLDTHLHVKIIPSAFSAMKLQEENVARIQQQFAGKFLAGHVGALDEEHKGQSLIIDLARRVQKSHPDILFLLVGGGKDEEYLKNLAKDLPNVHFVGFVENVYDYIAAFDLFLFPSKNEGLGSTLLDAMYLQKPIVASAVGGIVDLIENEKNGLLFSSGDLDAFTKQFFRLYENENLRKSIALNAAKHIEEYSPQNMAKKYLQTYMEILERSK